MSYPQKGCIANGSWRSSPTRPSAAAVCSDAMVAPTKTPCSQSSASATSGTFVARRPPKRIASTTTPSGSSQSSASDGHCSIPTVNRAFGCAAGVPDPGDHAFPCQSTRPAGGLGVMPSHHTSPSGRSATFVKIALPQTVDMATGLVPSPVPGATPKSPRSGLTARRRPRASGRSQAMSSPSVSTVQPGMVGVSIARFVFPHADGNAAATWKRRPSGLVIRMRSMCSASQPSSRAITEAMRREKHFLPSSALPP